MPNREIDMLSRRALAIVELIVDGDYQAVVNSCTESRLSAADIRRVIEGYGRHLVCPPENAYADLDAVRVQGSPEPTWSVRAPMWTAEEGRSDLTLELTMVQVNTGLRLEIEDLHVL